MRCREAGCAGGGELGLQHLKDAWVLAVFVAVSLFTKPCKVRHSHPQLPPEGPRGEVLPLSLREGEGTVNLIDNGWSGGRMSFMGHPEDPRLVQDHGRDGSFD